MCFLHVLRPWYVEFFLLNNAKIRKSYGIFCQPRIAIYTQISARILLPIFQRIKLLFHILLKPFVLFLVITTYDEKRVSILCILLFCQICYAQ